ncbi:dUTP diphosphatase [Bacillus infantis]|uniref:dUTP diphosphatase n=1 Tax=Bacillus infantis TaxID=324767 RepID=UPI001CD28F50|nr:dUTP diphosphatase [Bacillus infantis]MCA1036477.1 dUTP diphosphatase [Bacillus infantis]
MNINRLFDMQRALDLHIETEHQLTEENLFDRKILALLVELGELANETRCFKFWSQKPASEPAVILEEFVDGVHFILSLGIECGFGESAAIEPQEKGESLSHQFLNLYHLIDTFKASRTLEDFNVLVGAYISLAEMLGFSEEQIERAYVEKNEVNYERQRQGY